MLQIMSSPKFPIRSTMYSCVNARALSRKSRSNDFLTFISVSTEVLKKKFIMSNWNKSLKLPCRISNDHTNLFHKGTFFKKFNRYSSMRKIYTKGKHFCSRSERSFPSSSYFLSSIHQNRFIFGSRDYFAVENRGESDHKDPSRNDDEKLSIMKENHMKEEGRFDSDPYKLSIQLIDEEDTDIVGQALAFSGLKNGNTIFLKGDLGAGKTTLTRSFIRAYMDNPTFPVTSPSYLLDNTYKVFHPTTEEEVTIHHMDLYRLSPPTFGNTGEDTDEGGTSRSIPNQITQQKPKQKDIIGILGFPEVTNDCLCIIEWPDRLGPFYTPSHRLEITMQVDETSGDRVIHFEGIIESAGPTSQCKHENDWPLHIISSLKEQLQEEEDGSDDGDHGG